MSTALLERVEAAADWGPWIVGSNGAGQRNCFVLRYKDASDHNSRAEYHCNAKGDSIKYTMAGAEKKAWELNREAAEAKRRNEWLAKREAERLEQQTLAQEVREVAQCGTQNSEAIARWIIGNYTHNDEVADLQQERDDALISVEHERQEAEWAESQLAKSRERCDGLADEARSLLTQMGAFGAPLVADPLAYAIGNTDPEKVIDLSRNLIAALSAYEQES